MPDVPEIPEEIKALLEQGCIDEISWDDEVGDYLVTWNMENLKQLHPGLHDDIEEELLAEVSETISMLVEDGLLEISGLDEQGDWLFALTPKGIAAVGEMADELDLED